MARYDAQSRRQFLTAAGSLALAGLAGCTGDDGDTPTETADSGEMGTTEPGMSTTEPGMGPTDPASAPRATVDRFSDAAGTLHKRSENDALPGADEAIDFDAQFRHQGFGPDGEVIQYYDFDVQATDPAPIYAFFRENGDPVEDQLNVVGAVPGDEGYNDFWHVHKVTVSEDYAANTVTSVGGIEDADYDVTATETIKNCPIVPDGSTASMRHSADESSTGLVEGWYDGEVVSYFLFEEASLAAADGAVPLSPIYVTFNTNPGEDGGGPPSGFMTEDGSDQNHNVTATLPGDDGYSPLWEVNIYDNADFDSVSDLDSATSAEILNAGAAMVNCPVVSAS